MRLGVVVDVVVVLRVMDAADDGGDIPSSNGKETAREVATGYDTLLVTLS